MFSHGHKMYCMMNSGKPLTKQLADALLFNAHDMFQEGRTVQRIRARRYDGVIESSLEVHDFAGQSVVRFEANISTEKWESNTIQFIVRVEDLDGMEQTEWASLAVRVMAPQTVSFDEIPEEIQEQMQADGVDPDGEFLVQRARIERNEMPEE